MTCPRCNAEIFNDAEVCKFCNFDVKAHKAEFETAYKADTNNAENEMKWFKFLIYFLLFADALSAIGNGIINLMGGISFGGIYSDFGVLKPIDIAFGIIAFGTAAFCIFTRFQLANFKRNGPKLFYLLQAVMLIRYCAYEIICLAVIAPTTDVSVFSTVKNVLISVVSTAVYIFFNAIYFDRRKHLFEKGDK